MADSKSWYFMYQAEGKTSAWELCFSSERERIEREVKPAFVTVLDLSSVPEDNDWTKVRYRGPYYADFDADGDLELVIEKFQAFLSNLTERQGFDLSQARLYLTGGKGFHVEIPEACFMPRVSTNGTPYLAYVYRAMSESMVVDTLDLNVYTGKRGRMWRTTNVQRDNGLHKVQISPDDMAAMTPALYEELASERRPAIAATPASCNSRLAMLFERARDKVTSQMRGKKKRAEKANEILDPWKKSGQTPPTIERIMAGEVADGAGFQSIAMQLSIYATSVAMPLEKFLERCAGLIEKHVSDSRRYSTDAKRRAELSRMYEYMQENTLYDFEVGPLARLARPGSSTSDLGVIDRVDYGDLPKTETKTEDGAPTAPTTPAADIHQGVRKGFVMNGDGMWRRNGDNTESVCRATMRNVEAFYDLEKGVFQGYEFDIFVSGRRVTRTTLGSDAFVSGQSMRKFFAAHQISYQGGDPEANALLDIMNEKSANTNRVYVYPREGFFVTDNPLLQDPSPVKVFLTKSNFMSSLDTEDPDYFRLQYRPGTVTSAYNIDIDRAPALDESMGDSIEDMFEWSKPTVVADMLGWFIAAHYRSLYLYLFRQFPLLQVYGAAGAGKTKTVEMLGHLHWYSKDRISTKSAAAFTPFALDSHASTSTSAPFLIDEYKPRELKKFHGRYEKLKDVLKMSYTGAEIGERGTVNRGAEGTLALVKSKATAPIAFLGEAVEPETAIIERCICVQLSPTFHTKDRERAHQRLLANPVALSALGRRLIEYGFSIDLETMRAEVDQIRDEVESRLPDFEDEATKRLAPRLIFNRAVVIQSLHTLKVVLQEVFGDRFDASVERLINAKAGTDGDDAKELSMHSMGELSKVISRIALLSRARDMPYEMLPGKDYVVGDGWVEVRVERAYDQYRRYCAAINDTPLFDSLEVFVHALNAYGPCTDKLCVSSELREDGSTERIVRLSLRGLQKEGTQAFRN